MKTVAALAALLLAATAISGCPGGGGKGAATQSSSPPPAARDTAGTSAPADSAPSAGTDPVARGQAIYAGTEYSNTGLSCAHCHAASAAEAEGRIFIAHSGYGAATRGAWKITSQAQLDAKKGFAATLVDAANACVGAPYMNHKEKLIEGADAAALTAYLESISDPAAKDGQAFIIARAKSLPVSGLKPDKAHGQQIYEQSCKHCHDAGIKGLEELEGAKDWLNPVQVMAKVRKLDGWYDNNKDAKYASLNHGRGSQLAALYRALGVNSALAEENPCGNPCGGSGEAAEHEQGEGHAEGEDGEDDIFPEGAMPFFGTDILSDQDVVDVAFYVAEEL